MSVNNSSEGRLSLEQKISIYHAIEAANPDRIVGVSLQECIDNGNTFKDVLNALQRLNHDTAAAIAFVKDQMKKEQRP